MECFYSVEQPVLETRTDTITEHSPWWSSLQSPPNIFILKEENVFVQINCNFMRQWVNVEQTGQFSDYLLNWNNTGLSSSTSGCALPAWLPWMFCNTRWLMFNILPAALPNIKCIIKIWAKFYLEFINIKISKRNYQHREMIKFYILPDWITLTPG